MSSYCIQIALKYSTIKFNMFLITILIKIRYVSCTVAIWDALPIGRYSGICMSSSTIPTLPNGNMVGIEWNSVRERNSPDFYTSVDLVDRMEPDIG